METIFESIKLLLIKKEEESYKNEMETFYPDQTNEDFCAHCGKLKSWHLKTDFHFGKDPLFCNEIKKRKNNNQLEKEAYSLFIKISEQKEELFRSFIRTNHLNSEWESFIKTNPLPDIKSLINEI